MMESQNETYLMVLKKDAPVKLFKIISPESSFTTKNYNLNPNEKIQLTSREKDILKLIIQGKNNNEIASSLKMNVHTTKSNVCSIFQKLNVKDRVQAAVKATKENIL